MTGRRGFTLLELAIALALFAVLGYGLALAARAGGGAGGTVSRVTSESGALRSVTRRLSNELSATRDAAIAVAVLPDGNHELTFQVPIDDGGTPAWGVYDTSLGVDPTAWNRPDWSFRYTVREVPSGAGAVERRLVRQVLDDGGVVQKEDVELVGLEVGTANPPGFRVAQAGDLWELSVSIAADGQHGGRRVVLHVDPKN